MKRDNLILFGAAGVALYLVNRAGGVSATAQKIANGAKEILSGGKARFANGWRYFDDGTTIDPFGNYYKNGALIWKAPTVKKKTSGDEGAEVEPIFTPGTYDV